MPGLGVQSSDDNPGRLFVRAHAGPAIEFRLTWLPMLSRETASRLIQDQVGLAAGESQAPRRLIATRTLAESTRRMLREHHVSWAEQNTGVLHLAAPGLLVDIRGEDGVSKKGWPTQRAKLQGISGLVAETLVGWEAGQLIQLRVLAEKAGVSTALVSRVLQRLSALRIVEPIASGPSRQWAMIERGGLLDLWAEEEQRTPSVVTPLNVWSRSPNALLAKLPQLNQVTALWAVGGTAAANLYAPTLTIFPEPVIWVDAKVPFEEVARVLGGEKVERGANVFIWQSERNLALKRSRMIEPNESKSGLDQPLQLVSRPRAYIEALHGAGRSQEVAQNLREKILRNDSE